jgi:hypothetical protein
LAVLSRGDIAFELVEAVLAGHHLAPFRLKRRDYPLKQRSAKSQWQNTICGMPCVELFISNLLDRALSRIAEGTASRDGVIGHPHFEGRRRSEADQSSFDGDRHGMRAVIGAQLRQNAAHVALDGFLGNRELVGHHLVGVAGGYAHQHVQFSLR